MAPAAVPGVQGPWGQNVPMAAPYSASPPGAMAALNMIHSGSIPMDMVQMAGAGMPNVAGAPPGGQMPGGVPTGMLSPPGVPFAPGLAAAHGRLPGHAAPRRGPSGGPH